MGRLSRYTMQTRDIVVENPNGLHMRVASKIAQLSQEHGAQIHLISVDNRQASGASVLDMLTLGIQRGTTVRVTVDGPSENLVADQLTAILAVGGAA